MYKIALDAGHGLYTPGRRCLKQYDPYETREWQLNSRVADKVTQLLSLLYKDDVQVLRVDDITGQSDVPLATRVRTANSWNADLYISIHHNAGGGTGIISFSYGEGSSKSHEFRNTVYNRLIETTGNRGNRAEPLATANFYVIRHTNMPAVLLELGFMDNPADIEKVITTDYSDRCACGIVLAIQDFFGLQAEPLITIKSGWSEEDGGWRFYLGDTGNCVQNSWYNDGDDWYWFDGSGLAIHDAWYQDKGKWYYFDSSCRMVHSQWILYNNEPYYFLDSGEMYRGIAETNEDGAFAVQ